MNGKKIDETICVHCGCSLYKRVKVVYLDEAYCLGCVGALDEVIARDLYGGGNGKGDKKPKGK